MSESQPFPDYEEAQEQEDAPAKPLISSKLYDQIKFVAQVLLPALGTLYAALPGLPEAATVVAYIMAFDAFLGTLLVYLKKQYENSGAKYDGSIDVDYKEDGTKVGTISIDSLADPSDVDKLKEVTLKVNAPNAPPA